MKAKVRVLVSGRVQGVFFRAATARTAVANHVTGWVRNLPSGQVEAVFEGEKTDVETLVEFCKHGPSGAHVERAEVTWKNWKGEFDDFRVL
jgi:acylphosphatase